MADGSKVFLYSMAMDENKKPDTDEKPKVVEPTKTEEPPDTTDQELDDLLDSALEDFSRPPPHETDLQQSTQNARADAQGATQHTSDSLAQLEEQQARSAAEGSLPEMPGTQHFEEVMRELMGDDTDLAQHFEKLASMAGQIDDSEDSQKAFADTLQQTLSSLAENTDNLDGDVGDEDLLRTLAGMGLGGEGADLLGGDDGMMGAMQGMMRSLLSKEVLYPALKEISTKYPEWLESNKSQVSPSEYSRYEQQYELMSRVCQGFEEEKESDAEDVKQERFERILDTMQKMQACGQPPEALLAELGPSAEFPVGLGLGEGHMPNSDQCAIM